MQRHLFAFLTLAALAFGLLPTWTFAQGDQPFPSAALLAALDDFAHALDERWSYRHANEADFAGAIAALRTKAAAGMSIDEFGLELHKIIALGIDGHSGVVGYQLPGMRYLPFLVEPLGERFVAFTPDRNSFLADGFPYITKIDGRNIADWCEAAAVIVPKGSPQYIRHRCLGRLRNLDFVRRLMALPAKDNLEVELLSRDGQTRRTLTLNHANSLPTYGVWPRSGSRILEENVGYLRLPYMSTDPSVQEIKQGAEFRNTRGLIIDVRDNDGGDRDALRLMYSYLAAPGDAPRVFTAAAYRLHTAHTDRHLAGDHGMYRADAKEWSEVERKAVMVFAGTFTAAWKLPAEQFSEWHYMTLSRLDDPAVYYYDKPVVVRMNGKNFSATDMFLVGLKGLRNVTLFGMPSAGGSANTQEIQLGTTPLRLRIGSMASFQADGRLFDGHGITPDVMTEPTPDYYIGGRDFVLTEALKRIIGM
jgi:Peptidase family S41